MTDRERLNAILAYCKQYPRRYCRSIPPAFFPVGWDTAVVEPSPEPPPEPPPPPPLEPNAPPPVKTGWTRVIDSRFDQDGVLPHPWASSEGGGFVFRTSGSRCRPENATVQGGLLRLLMKWDNAGWGGPGWYTGYVAIKRANRVAPFASTDQCVTVRYRIQTNGVRGHSNVPMRWPAGFTGHPNTMGEEDCWEGSGMTGATTFLHYTNPDGTAGRVSKSHTGIDMSQFHVYRFERRSHVYKVFVDNLDVPIWSYTGTSVTLPDYPKCALLQQESKSYYEAGSAGQPQSSGTEEIQIDWVTVDNPA
jgi:hypothetical protein